MRLPEQLEALRNRMRENVPPDVLARMDRADEELANSGITKRCVQEGQEAPDFILSDNSGTAIRLSKLLQKAPVVLSFYRGRWCPFCNEELLALEQALPKIRKMGADLIAVSPQTPDNSLYTAEKQGLSFPILSDLGNRVARKYGLVYTFSADLRDIYESQFEIDLAKYNGDDSCELPIPATYVIDRKGIVRRAFLETDYTKRMDPADIVSALRRIKVQS